MARGSLPEGLSLGLMLGVGFTVGSAGLALVERRMRTRSRRRSPAGRRTSMTVEQAEMRWPR